MTAAVGLAGHMCFSRNGVAIGGERGYTDTMRLSLQPVLCVLAVFSALLPAPGARAAEAEPDKDKLTVTFGGFVDTYYLYDFNRPPGLDRSLSNGAIYVTTGERSNEFNVNLAFIEAKVSSDRVRGRLAIQAGTSVQANYLGESAGLGVVKGPVPAELIQEAVAGYRIADGLWVDGGIFLSHLGFESFISRDDWTYTRSLVADFSPYYESGVKLTYQVSPLWTAQILLINGWSDIAETNTPKSVGLHLAYVPSERFDLTYNNYTGLQPGSLLRVYNELIGRVSLTPSFQLSLTFDEGTQVQPDGGGTDFWYGASLLARWQLSQTVALGARLERYADPNDVIVPDPTPNGFEVNGASINVDVQLHKNLVWRNEARILLSDQDAVFTALYEPLTSDKFLVTSLGLSF